MKIMSLIAVACLALCTSCSSWTPEKQAAVKEAAVNEGLSLALAAVQSYSDKGSVNAAQVATNGLGGFAALLRALEMPNLPKAPTKAELADAALLGSGNKPALAKEFAPIVNKLSDALKSGAPPAASIETVALGLDRAQAKLAGKP